MEKRIFSRSAKVTVWGVIISLVAVLVAGYATGRFHSWADQRDEVLLVPPLISGWLSGWASVFGMTVAGGVSPRYAGIVALAGPVNHEITHWRLAYQHYIRRISLYQERFPDAAGFRSGDEYLEEVIGFGGTIGYMMLRYRGGAALSLLGKYRVPVSGAVAYSVWILMVALGLIIAWVSSAYLARSLRYCPECGEPVLRRELGILKQSKAGGGFRADRLTIREVKNNAVMCKGPNTVRLDTWHCPACEEFSAISIVCYRSGWKTLSGRELSAAKRSRDDIDAIAETLV